MTADQFIPPGIEPKEWRELSPFGRVLVEAGMYLSTKELLPRQLYIEHLLSKVDLGDDRHPGHLRADGEMCRMELKLFLQFLQRADSGAYARRTIAVAEAREMRLSIIEDGASLYLKNLSHKERIE